MPLPDLFVVHFTNISCSDPSEDKSVFGGRVAAEAAAEEAEANQDWTSIRGSGSASGSGFAGASAPAGPSRADDSSNWTSLRGPVRLLLNLPCFSPALHVLCAVGIRRFKRQVCPTFRAGR